MPCIRFWVYDDILASGVSAPIDVLTAANTLLARQRPGRRGAQHFTWRVESLDGKPVRTASGQMLAVDGPFNPRTAADAVVLTAPFVEDIAGFMRERHVSLEPLLKGVQRQHARGALIATYCTGSFLLAEAGLLDGRVATTHWSKASEFVKRYPLVRLQPSDVVTEQQRVLCGGAVTSYLNLALKLVEKLADETLAQRTARHLLIDINRESQTAYAMADAQSDAAHSDRLVGRAQHWMRKHMRQRARLAELARQLGTSERTLNRRFKQVLGAAPLHYWQSLRIATAKGLLEAGGLSVDAVTAQVGYEDVSTFRQLFRRETGLSPTEYRRRFGRAPSRRTGLAEFT